MRIYRCKILADMYINGKFEDTENDRVDCFSANGMATAIKKAIRYAQHQWRKSSDKDKETGKRYIYIYKNHRVIEANILAEADV